MGRIRSPTQAETGRVNYHLVVRPEVDADLMEAET